MDLSKTVDQLVAKAGANLSVSDSAEELSAEDSATIEGYVGPVVLQLAAEDIIDLTAEVDGDEIPSEAFLPLADVLTDAVKAEFGRANDATFFQLAQVARDTLKRIARAAPVRNLRLDTALRPRRAIFNFTTGQ